ncbi:MAG: NAD-dependent epimerase/dehydratase family protein [Halioglobus sp.]
MKVFVTGGTGFIGSYTCHALLEAGHSVKLFVRNKAKAKALFGGKIRSIVVGDITNAADVKKGLTGCDAVIHLAAMVSTSKDDAERVYQQNVAAAKNVLGLAADAGCKTIVHVSSITAIYNPKAKVLDHTSPLGVAKNAYGRSKVECERFARNLQEKGAPVHITYPASVIGPDAPTLTEPHEGLIANLFGLGPNMPSGNQYVDVRDVARAHTTLISKTLKPGRYPLGGHYVSWNDMYAILERLTGRNLITVPIPGMTMRMVGRTLDALKPVMSIGLPVSQEAMQYATKWVILDNRKTEQDFKLKFRPFEESLIETIRWLERENHITRGQAGLLSRHEGTA